MITETGFKKYPYKLRLTPKIAQAMRYYCNYAHTVWIFKSLKEAEEGLDSTINDLRRVNYDKAKSLFNII